MKEIDIAIRRTQRKLNEARERKIDELKDLIDTLQYELKKAEEGRHTSAGSYGCQLAKIAELETKEDVMLEVLDSFNIIKGNDAE